MIDVELSSVPFFMFFNFVVILLAYNFWYHFPRNNGQYRDPLYYLKPLKSKMKEVKNNNNTKSELPLKVKGKTSMKPKVDSRSG
ncbi:hypothetical protein PMAYCL1PPCAC_09795 [Pristionchus mayeri]|uniref:Uncharacterized protein n=1 Tax=Pristionchus mayeri TaxID=1317129 RepID=A0AAN4ZM93_9BILA|nr:hypothetical protein PMAYCL1PPCAC_09795 [Pristionchus mayeri]